MQINPYSPPTAELTSQPKPPGSPLKAVLLGLSVDVGGSLISGLLLGAAYGMVLASLGMSAEEILAASQHLASSPFMIIAGVLGLAFSVLGGFVCARIARRSDDRLGFILGGLSAGLGFLLSDAELSLGVNLLFAVFTFLSVLLGNRYGRAKVAAATGERQG